MFFAVMDFTRAAANE